MKFDEVGRELPEGKPIELPVGAQRPETLQEMMRRLIQVDVSRLAEERGAESFDEANDFEIEDEDPELAATHYELHEEVVDAEREVRKERAQKAAARSRKGGDGGADEEGVQEETDGASDRDNIPHGSSKKVTRSPQRRQAGRREDADTTQGDEDS